MTGAEGTPCCACVNSGLVEACVGCGGEPKSWVVAATVGSFAVVATQQEPRESRLIGMHGSLTSADQLVPLLTLSSM